MPGKEGKLQDLRTTLLEPYLVCLLRWRGTWRTGRIAFELFQDLFCTVDDRPGHARQLSDVDTVALVGGTGNDAMLEDHPVALLGNSHVIVVDPGQNAGKVNELMVVSGEERSASKARVVVDVLDH